VHLIPFNTVKEFQEHIPHLGEPDYKALEEMAEKLRF
jgi:hypothetical protein